MEWKDEIIEEVRKTRDAYAAQFSYDLDAIYRDLQEKEKQSKRKVVSLPRREPETWPLAKAS